MVASRGDQFAVVARRNVPAGGLVMRLDGPLVDKPGRYTVQVDVDLHVDAEASPEHEGRYPLWRFLNHSCAPNCRVVGRTLRAIAPIKKGDEVTFDYDATEWDMASPFACMCGAPTCRRRIRGYRHLKPAMRAAMTWAAPHVVQAREAVAVAAARR